VQVNPPLSTKVVSFSLYLQWPVRENSPPITHATFSCDSQLIYASFMDATVGIFNASSLRLQCRILPASYLPPNIRYSVLCRYDLQSLGIDVDLFSKVGCIKMKL